MPPKKANVLARMKSRAPAATTPAAAAPPQSPGVPPRSPSPTNTDQAGGSGQDRPSNKRARGEGQQDVAGKKAAAGTSTLARAERRHGDDSFLGWDESLINKDHGWTGASPETLQFLRSRNPLQGGLLRECPDYLRCVPTAVLKSWTQTDHAHLEKSNVMENLHMSLIRSAQSLIYLDEAITQTQEVVHARKVTRENCESAQKKLTDESERVRTLRTELGNLKRERDEILRREEIDRKTLADTEKALWEAKEEIEKLKEEREQILRDAAAEKETAEISMIDQLVVAAVDPLADFIRAKLRKDRQADVSTPWAL